MQYKLADGTAVPITAPLNVQNAISTLGGLALLTGGVGLSLTALKELATGIYDAHVSSIQEPSGFVQREVRRPVTPLTSELMPDTEPPDKKKKSLIKKNAGVSDWLCGTDGTGQFTPMPHDRHFAKDVAGKNANRIYYDASTAKSDNKFINDVVLPMAANPMAAAAMLLPVGGAAVFAAPIISKKLVKWLSNDLMGGNAFEEQKVQNSKAKKVYTDAVNTLLKLRKPEEKQGSFTKSAITAHGAVGSAPFTVSLGEAPKKDPDKEYTKTAPSPFSFNNVGGVGVGLVGLAALLGLMRGGMAGYDNGTSQISQQQQLLRAWKAQQKLRDYNYTPIAATLDKEPQDIAVSNAEVQKAIKQLNQMEEEEGNPLNPFKVDSLVSGAGYVG